jgi:NADPH:quinone reductase
VLESVGGASLTTALSRLAPRGKLFWFGQASREPGTLRFSVAGAAPFASIELFIYWRTGASDADDLATLVRLVAAGHLHPEIGLVADWHETADALIALRERRVRGKAVLTVG